MEIMETMENNGGRIQNELTHSMKMAETDTLRAGPRRPCRELPRLRPIKSMNRVGSTVSRVIRIRDISECAGKSRRSLSCHNFHFSAPQSKQRCAFGGKYTHPRGKRKKRRKSARAMEKMSRKEVCVWGNARSPTVAAISRFDRFFTAML
jgi:hypothetical protein